jgi:ParB/RepB/Spo0J family partition protein
VEYGQSLPDIPEPEIPYKEVDGMGLDIKEIPLDTLYISPYNVRTEPGDLTELIASIRDMGVLEPILVRQMGEMYEVIAGRRRLEAARSIGLQTIPASVLDVTDLQAIIVSLLENVQRKDLTLAERVETYQLLRQLDAEYQNQHNLAKAIGFSHQKISQDFQAYEVLRKLQPHGFTLASHLTTSAVERQQGRVLPEYHAVLLHQAMTYFRDAGTIPEEDADEQLVKLALLIESLSQQAAKATLEEVKAGGELASHLFHSKAGRQRTLPRRKLTGKRGHDGGAVTCAYCEQQLSLLHLSDDIHQVSRSPRT